MKQTGSTSCLLRPRNSLSQNDLERLARDPPTATVLTINNLPPYNADRLYIQSELQVQSSLHILSEVDSYSLTPSIILYVLWDSEFFPTPRTFADGILSEKVRQCLMQTGEKIENEVWEQAKSNPRLSNYSPRRQFSDPFPSDLKYLQSTSLSFDEFESSEQTIRIYVVVDKVASSRKHEGDDIGELPDFPDLSVPSTDESQPQCQKPVDELKSSQQNENSHSDPEIQKLSQHVKEIKTAESLARAVASSRFLRNRIDGICIGVTTDSRAAPGLELCMDVVSRHSKERRVTSNSLGSKPDNMSVDDNDLLKSLRNRSPEKSPISVVVCKPDDVDDINTHSHHHHHHHSSCHLLQSRVTAEWNGKGDYNTFSDRAMQDWRQIWSETSPKAKCNMIKRRVPRISRKNCEDEEDVHDEPISTVMVIFFIAGVAWYIWNCYGDQFYSMSLSCDSTQQD